MAVDPAAFKDVLSSFASGVTVVTTMFEARPYGLTVSAFSSVSARPPRVLVCLGNDTDTKPLLERAGSFTVHFLGREQSGLALRFAKLLPDAGDPFVELAYGLAPSGSPLLAECTAWLDCRVESAVIAGDHTIFVGAVEAAARRSDAEEPLLYYRRAFRKLEQA